MDLLLLPRRREKYRKTLKASILATLLDRHTYYVFYSLRKGLGTEYARAMLRDSMYDMVLTMYKDKGLEMAFYTDIARDLCEWGDRIQFLGLYNPTEHREKFVFFHGQGIPAKRMYFQYGDHLFNRLVDYPSIQMEMSNIMFDVIDRKGDPGQEPVIHANGRRTVSMFVLKTEESQDSMKD
ncbi:hypothetical protein D3C81_548470 [compost metagenome]